MLRIRVGEQSDFTLSYIFSCPTCLAHRRDLCTHLPFPGGERRCSGICAGQAGARGQGRVSGPGPGSALAGPVCLRLGDEAFSDFCLFSLGWSDPLLCVWWVCVNVSSPPCIDIHYAPGGTLDPGLFPVPHSEGGEILPHPQRESRVVDVRTHLPPPSTHRGPSAEPSGRRLFEEGLPCL